MKWISSIALFSFGLLSISCGVNIFDGLDNPDGDEQLISGARACFDDGDLACALELYGKASGSESDIVNAESAFAILDQNNADMGVFITAFGSGSNGGKAVTELANLFAPDASSSKRSSIYTAYQKVDLIADKELRGLVRFATSVVMAGYLLGEVAGSNKSLEKSDLATDPTTCKDAAETSCATETSCDQSSFDNLGTSDDSITLNNPGSRTLSFYMINSAISEASAGLSEIGVAGKFADTSTLLSTIEGIDLAAAGAKRCYRQQLLIQNIGND